MICAWLLDRIMQAEPAANRSNSFAFDSGRRRFLRLLGQSGLLGTLLPPLFADPSGDSVTISLLHTTDLHGHIRPTTDYHGVPDLGGLARCATQIARWRATNPNHLLLDIGDVYQGTAVSWQNRGALMIRCFNALGYDGWVIGNHDFDWGYDCLAQAINDSHMPVLCGNACVNGQPIGQLPPASAPWSRVVPWLVREVAGFRIGIVAVTTPGLPYWLTPEELGPFEVTDPLPALAAQLQRLAEQKPDAIILAGHMGLVRRDDYANQVGTLTRAFPQLTVCLGGHTHQDRASEHINGVLYTQADHYGIYAGKVDLTFDRATRRLLASEAQTVHMDATIPGDPLILSLAQADLAAADRLLATPIGTVIAPIGVESTFGAPSGVERLIGSAIRSALAERGCRVDAVIHGLFEGAKPILPGPKTVADAWAIVPYENSIVTIEVSRGELFALARDLTSQRGFLNLLGCQVQAQAAGRNWDVLDILSRDGSPLPDQPFYRVAMNSHDSQSGGRRWLVLAEMVGDGAHRRVRHPLQVRDTLIEYFKLHPGVDPSTFSV